MTLSPPAELRAPLLAWFDAHRRELPWRTTRDVYRIWVSEVMLQQTRVETVTPYYYRFVKRLPNLSDLAAADRQIVLKLWEGLGYYARARNLHRAAQVVCAEFDGRIPRDWERFRRLPGVGDYIAAAVLSIAFNLPFAVADGNVKRVLARLLCLPQPVNRPGSHKTFQTAAQEWLDAGDPGRFNQAVMELGALVCRPVRPACPRCPIADGCRAFSSGTLEDYPKRLAAGKTPQRRAVAGVVRKNGRILIVQRPADGFLGGLWELPGGETGPEKDAAAECERRIREKVHLIVMAESRLVRVRHVYTHFRLVMDVYDCRWVSGRIRLGGPSDFRWVKPSEIQRFPLHKAVHKALSYVK